MSEPLVIVHLDDSTACSGNATAGTGNGPGICTEHGRLAHFVPVASHREPKPASLSRDAQEPALPGTAKLAAVAAFFGHMEANGHGYTDLQWHALMKALRAAAPLIAAAERERVLLALAADLDGRARAGGDDAAYSAYADAAEIAREHVTQEDSP